MRSAPLKKILKALLKLLVLHRLGHFPYLDLASSQEDLIHIKTNSFKKTVLKNWLGHTYSDIHLCTRLTYTKKCQEWEPLIRWNKLTFWHKAIRQQRPPLRHDTCKRENLSCFISICVQWKSNQFCAFLQWWSSRTHEFNARPNVFELINKVFKRLHHWSNR